MKIYSKTLTVLVALFTSAIASSSYACSVTPLNVDKASLVLGDLALEYMGLDQESPNLRGLTIDNAEAEYIWTPMCPKGHWAKGNVTISMFSVIDAPCQVTVNVYHEIIKEDDTRHTDTKYEVIENTCYPF